MVQRLEPLAIASRRGLAVAAIIATMLREVAKYTINTYLEASVSTEGTSRVVNLENNFRLILNIEQTAVCGRA